MHMNARTIILTSPAGKKTMQVGCILFVVSGHPGPKPAGIQANSRKPGQLYNRSRLIFKYAGSPGWTHIELLMMFLQVICKSGFLRVGRNDRVGTPDQ